MATRNRRLNPDDLPQVHIDIASHNQATSGRGRARNPTLRHSVKEIKQSIESVADERHTRLMAGGDSEGEAAHKVARYLGTLKKKYHNHPSILKYIDSLQEGYRMYLVDPRRGKNPAPRRGTASPRRRSQITKKPPSKRLVARRKKNTDPGYFPNPSISQKAANLYLQKVENAVSYATVKHKDPIVRQAKISYAQGMVEAGELSKMIKPAHARDLMNRIKASME